MLIFSTKMKEMKDRRDRSCPNTTNRSRSLCQTLQPTARPPAVTTDIPRRGAEPQISSLRQAQLQVARDHLDNCDQSTLCSTRMQGPVCALHKMSQRRLSYRQLIQRLGERDHLLLPKKHLIPLPKHSIHANNRSCAPWTLVSFLILFRMDGT